MTAYPLKPDPATKALLQKIAESGVPPYDQQTPAEARAASRASGKVLDIDPPAVGRIVDSRLPGPGGEIPVRYYYPEADPSGPLPVLIYFHGGGYVVGDLDTHDNLCRCYCKQASAMVVAVDYRLAPEHRFPAAVDDSIAAFRWIAENGREVGADPGRIAVGGDSAGGTLAAVVTHVARAEGIPLRAQLLLYPLVDMSGGYASYGEHVTAPPITKNVLAWFWQQYFGGPVTNAIVADERASPMRVESLAGLPPAFVLTAGQDPLRDEGMAYASRLSSEGVEVAYMCAMGTIHAFLRMGKAVPAALDAIDSSAAFLKRRLHGGHS